MRIWRSSCPTTTSFIHILIDIQYNWARKGDLSVQLIKEQTVYGSCSSARPRRQCTRLLCPIHEGRKHDLSESLLCKLHSHHVDHCMFEQNGQMTTSSISSSALESHSNGGVASTRGSGMVYTEYAQVHGPRSHESRFHQQAGTHRNHSGPEGSRRGYSGGYGPYGEVDRSSFTRSNQSGQWRGNESTRGYEGYLDQRRLEPSMGYDTQNGYFHSRYPRSPAVPYTYPPSHGTAQVRPDLYDRKSSAHSSSVSIEPHRTCLARSGSGDTGSTAGLEHGQRSTSGRSSGSGPVHGSVFNQGKKRGVKKHAGAPDKRFTKNGRPIVKQDGSLLSNANTASDVQAVSGGNVSGVQATVDEQEADGGSQLGGGIDRLPSGLPTTLCDTNGVPLDLERLRTMAATFLASELAVPITPTTKLASKLARQPRALLSGEDEKNVHEDDEMSSSPTRRHLNKHGGKVIDVMTGCLSATAATIEVPFREDIFDSSVSEPCSEIPANRSDGLLSPQRRKRGLSDSRISPRTEKDGKPSRVKRAKTSELLADLDAPRYMMRDCLQFKRDNHPDLPSSGRKRALAWEKASGAPFRRCQVKAEVTPTSDAIGRVSQSESAPVVPSKEQSKSDDRSRDEVGDQEYTKGASVPPAKSASSNERPRRDRSLAE